ncbi:hypothetical protein CLV59_105405 [Chitinophaga dinghuensis]|uniref:SH3 domain-containing protein n=1 Tax=Chitinophaga dinghuensis TaxID=1539050 RepID=A0A327VZB4_9BACT|nr:hypothetical protein [Chitinophaga dinghuensis]RAJ80296.1 hypothetical protein CLV59_105405 [Chitinophaga dinghuensis]
MKINIAYLLMLLLLLMGVSSCDFQNAPQTAATSNGSPPADTRLPENDQLIPALNTGVITLKPDSNRTFLLLNADGSTWKEITFDDAFADTSLSPYAAKSENWLLMFRCTAVEKDKYKVIVNESTGEEKYISTNDYNFMKKTWEENITEAVFVDFNETNNPLRASKSDTAKVIHVPDNVEEDVFYRPEKIEGDWLHVQTNDEKYEGWIKWKNKQGRIIVGIFYDA